MDIQLGVFPTGVLKYLQPAANAFWGLYFMSTPERVTQLEKN